MHPRRTRSRWPLPLLFAALGTSACAPLKSEPTPPPVQQEEPPPELRVTVQTEGPAFCRDGQWTLSVSVEGGTPERVELLMDAQEPTVLEAPYQHVIDCATHAEGPFSFVARAVDEDRTFEAEAVSVTVDRTPPTIVAQRPVHSHPSVSSPLAFVFSEPLLPGSLQAAPTQLRDQDGFSVAHQANLSEDGTVLELIPTTPLRPTVTLHAALLQRTLTDRAGNPLDPSLTNHWLTHSATYWPFGRSTEHLYSGNHLLTPSSLALVSSNEGAQPVVGFTDNTSERWEPAVARWDGQAWQRLPPLRAEEARAQPAWGLQVVAKRGVIFAAWLEEDETTGFDQLHVARYHESTWQHLGGPYDTQARFTKFKVAFDWRARPLIAMERWHGPNDTDVHVIQWNDVEWLPMGEALSANPAPNTPSWRPAIAADTEVLVSWLEIAPETDALHLHVRVFNNGRWHAVGESIPIPANAAVTWTEIAFQSANRVALAWSETDPTVWVSTLRFSSIAWRSGQPAWSTPEVIEVMDTADMHQSLRLAVDLGNEPWLAWTEWRPLQETKSYYRRRRATGWEPKQFISGQELSAFLLDENAFPWALSGFTVVRPQ